MTVAPFSLADDIHIEFPIAHDTPWATLHRGALQVELGPVHGPDDLEFIIAVAANLLAEWAGPWSTYRSPDGKERYVLCDTWILVARTDTDRLHWQYDTTADAATAWARITGATP